MKRFFCSIVIALIGLTLAGNTATATTTRETDDKVQSHRQRPRNQQRGQAGQLSPQEYAQKRLDVIAKAAGLTEVEKSMVGEELAKYDNSRLQTWVETRQIHEDIAQLGDKATDNHYRDSLTKLADLSAQRQKANQDFIKVLSQKLSPKKAYLVYHSQRNFNANTGRRLRQE